ncbi:GNAT family N-acetyltransferase, partial [archaeon]
AKRAGEFHVAISHDVGADACTRQSVPVGCFRIARVAASPAIAEVSLLAVAPAIQRAGVAQRLLRHALLLADAMPDVTHVQVKVLSSKPWLVRWYAHAGFTEVAIEAFAGAPLKPGVTQSLQLHVMQLSL